MTTSTPNERSQSSQVRQSSWQGKGGSSRCILGKFQSMGQVCFRRINSTSSSDIGAKRITMSQFGCEDAAGEWAKLQGGE